MRTITLCLALVAASTATGLSSRELHRRYGEPNMERFTGRPGINVTVEYGPDRLACEMLIASVRADESDLIKSSGQLMPSQAVTALIDELAPSAERGPEINSGSLQSSCGVGNVNEFEKVYIIRGISACAASKESEDTETLIRFKRETCPKRPLPATIKR